MSVGRDDGDAGSRRGGVRWLPGAVLGQWLAALAIAAGGLLSLAARFRVDVGPRWGFRGLLLPIDQRFYRRKYDAARTLAAFGASLRDNVELGALTDKLLGVVSETMRPEHAWLWLRRPAGRDRG